MDRPGTYDDITEALRKLLLVISGLQDIAKQQNLMLLDLYDRIVKLEVLDPSAEARADAEYQRQKEGGD